MDLFVHPAINPRDGALLVLAVVVLSLILFATTTSIFSSIQLYAPILIIAIVIVGFAIMSKGRLFNEVTFGTIQNDRQLYTEIAIGLAIGGVLAYLLVSQSFTLIQAPLPFSVIGAQSANAYQIYILAGLFGVIIEWLFFDVAMTGTIASALRSTNTLALIGFFGGVAFLFLGGILGAVVLTSFASSLGLSSLTSGSSLGILAPVYGVVLLAIAIYGGIWIGKKF